MGKVLVPAFKDEDEEIIQGIHEPIVSEELFYKVQKVIKSKGKGKKKHYDKVSDAMPLRAMLTCPKCGRRMTSSSSKGRNQHYNYYHCRPECGERIPVEKAHEALKEYFNEVQVKPEIAELYVEVMESIYKADVSKNDKEVKKYSDMLLNSEKKLSNLEEKWVMNEIEKDSYHFMKPKFKEEIRELKERIDEIESNETNFTKYLKFGVNIIQNLDLYYDKAKTEDKQKLIGSIFPENLIIENSRCRTARECEVILGLKGFEADFKGKKLTKKSAFPILYTGDAKYRTFL